MRRAMTWLAGIAGGTAVAGFAGLLLFAATISHYSTSTPAPQARDAHGIVVLTGGDRRILEAARLFNEGHSRRLLISGVHQTTTREDLKRASPLAPVLFDCCIDVGYGALTTVGNAHETKAWAEAWGFSRLVVVTSNYHMPRSLAELARTMPNVELVAHPVISRSYRSEGWWLYPEATRIVVVEYLKFLPTLGRLARARLLGVDDAPIAAPSDLRDTRRAAVERAKWQRTATAR